MVDKSELDKRSSERVNDAVTRLRKGQDGALADIVLSERVYADLDKDNIVLHSFNLDAIKSYIPYSDRIYVTVCPVCIDDENFDDYTTLLETNSIVPVLGARYESYGDRVVDATYAHHHVGPHEYYALRSLEAGGSGLSRVCSHCIEERAATLIGILAKKKSKGFSERGVRALMVNLHPYVEPDFDLIDRLEAALGARDEIEAKSILDMSWALSEMRAASTFNSPLIVPGKAYQSLPEGYSRPTDEVRAHAIKVQKDVGDGLGIRIPEGLALRDYIEVASDFRPRLQALTSKVGQSAPNNWQQSFDKEIMGLNAEVARISTSKRFIALAAAVEFYANNQIKLNAALVAASLSLGAGVLGCSPAAVAGTGGGAVLASTIAGMAKGRGLITGGPAVARAGRTVKNAVRPVLDDLIAKYVGASPMAVSVLSLKRDLKS